jgi:hypothetical protein
VLGVVVLGLFGVSEARVPEILVEEGDALFDGGREVLVASDQSAHAPPVVIIDLINNGIDSLFEVTLRLAVMLIQLPEKLHHRVLPLREGPLVPVRHQLQNPVLHEHHRHFLMGNSL